MRQGCPTSAGKERFGNGGTLEYDVTTSVAGSLPMATGGVALSVRRRGDRRRVGPCLLALDGTLRRRFAAEAAAAAALDTAYTRAQAAYETAGADDVADRLAASLYAGDALAGLSVEGLLDHDDVEQTARLLAEVSGDRSLDATRLEVFLRAASNPLLTTLPPLFAAETILRLLVTFGLATEASLWMRPRPNRVECTVSLGDEEPSRRMRLAARLLLGGKHATVGSRSLIRALPVLRFGRVDAALVVRVLPQTRPQARLFLAETAASLSPLLERAMLLERGAEREAELVQGTERRLTRLGFDLHDGPIQDVLALAADARYLRDELDPFVLPERRDHTHRSLDDMANRLVELDRELRELAHSLESRSAVSRPLEEVLHREVDAMCARSHLKVSLRIDGTSAFLTASQRIALFRAAQEALSNAREHSGASHVWVELRCGRSWTELRVRDDGSGFHVEHGLASAAKRGRLGLIGISERVRMLGGTFSIDSAPGRPTVLTVSLPRWEPLHPAAE
jgi:signal transduction histidine kinase